MVNRSECLPGIRRPSRLGAVWLSFRTNWTIWPIPLFILFFLMCGTVPALSRYFGFKDSLPFPLRMPPSAPMPKPTETILSREYDVKTQSMKRADHDRKIDWAHLKSLTVDHLYFHRELLTPGAIPLLESLTLHGSITDQGLIDICKLYDLKSLTLMDYELTPASWRVLARETSLEYLELMDVYNAYVSPVKQPPLLIDEISLEWPPNLRTLRCEDHRGIALERLDEWQELPHLQTLCTTLLPRDAQQAEEMIDVLQTFPSLKTIYALELKSQIPNYFETYNSAMKRLKAATRQKPIFRTRIYGTSWGQSSIYPATYDRNRMECVAPILGFGLVFALILTLQMSAVLVSSNSVLTPKFVGSNVLPVVVTLSVTTAVSFLLLLLAGCSTIASLGLCGAPTFVWALMVKLTRWMQSFFGATLAGLSHMSTVAAPLSLLWGLAFPLCTNFAGKIDAFLEGSFPWAAGGLLIGSIWGAYDLIAWHIQLRRDLDAAGAGEVTFSMFDQGNFNAWCENVSALRANGRERANWLTRFNDARLERFIHRRIARNNADQQSLWRICHSSPLLNWFLWGVFACIFLVPLLSPRFSAARSLPVIASSQLIFILLMYFGQIWQRRSWIEMELLRPTTRRDWTNTWFRGIGSGITPILLVPFATGIYLFLSGQPPNWTAADIFVASLFLLGLVSVFVAFAIWVLTRRRLFVAIASVVVGSISGFVMLLTPIVVFQSSNAVIGIPPILVPCVVLLFAITALFLVLAWRRWRNWEVGNVD